MLAHSPSFSPLALGSPKGLLAPASCSYAYNPSVEGSLAALRAPLAPWHSLFLILLRATKKYTLKGLAVQHAVPAAAATSKTSLCAERHLRAPSVCASPYTHTGMTPPTHIAQHLPEQHHVTLCTPSTPLWCCALAGHLTPGVRSPGTAISSFSL